MKISLNLIREVNEKYQSAGDPAPHGVDDLVERIGAQLGAVEDVEDYGAKYAGVVVARVVSCVDHPNADRLHVCMIDDSGVVENVERNDQGHVQVVCGAPNVREGLSVAWLPPGAVVPETFHHEAPFTLDARELRGVVSNGMLASAKELGLSDDHEGILEIEADAQPGASFAEVYHLDDFIIDIENKMFTHRPDCFGNLGVAREIEGIYHRPYKSPEWYRIDPQLPPIETDELPLSVDNEVNDVVPRFSAIVLSNVQVGPSPSWLQSRLIRLGARPINNIVDYTNFFMLETGQPLHAYDYDKVASGTLGVRMAREGEKLNLLNGKQAELTDKDIIITDGEKPIGLGGAMGGSDTEVDENTKNIIIECANFDMYAIRRTSMRHGLFTDAVTRFNKGQSPLQTLAVLVKIVEDIRQHAGGKVASSVVDDNHLPSDMRERGSVYSAVNVRPEFINARLGLSLSADEIKQLLENVEFQVSAQDDALTITAPFWRTDIEIPEDIVEEVGRLYGYDRLPLELPRRDITPAHRNHMLDIKTRIRQALSRSGANEVLTYSFAHGNILDRVGQSRDDSFQITNALSPDLQYYRQTVLPSLLNKVHANIKAGYDEFALFEIGSGHARQVLGEDGLPRGIQLLDVVYTSRDESVKSGAAYFQARRLLEEVLAALNIRVDFIAHTESEELGNTPFDHTRTASIYLQGTQTRLGTIGELKAEVRKSLKLPVRTAAFSLVLDDVAASMDMNIVSSYHPLSKYPGTSQDICLRVASNVQYAKVRAIFERVLNESTYDTEILPLDIYAPESADYKQITIRIHLNNPESTITAAETQGVVNQIVELARTELNAEYV